MSHHSELGPSPGEAGDGWAVKRGEKTACTALERGKLLQCRLETTGVHGCDTSRL